jgi:hypothetical protein
MYAQLAGMRFEVLMNAFARTAMHEGTQVRH